MQVNLTNEQTVEYDWVQWEIQKHDRVYSVVREKHEGLSVSWKAYDIACMLENRRKTDCGCVFPHILSITQSFFQSQY